MKAYDEVGITIHIFLALIVIFMIYSRKKYIKIIKDFTNPQFVFFFILILILSYWGLYIREDEGRTKRATQYAIQAFIIAYFAHLDLVFVAFIFVWAMVYHQGDDWV